MAWFALAVELACVQHGAFDPFAGDTGSPFDEDPWEPYVDPVVEVEPRFVWGGPPLDAYQPGGWRDVMDTGMQHWGDATNDVFAGHPRAPADVCDPRVFDCPSAVGDVRIDWGVREVNDDWFRFPAFSFADRERVALSDGYGFAQPEESRATADVPREGCDTQVLAGNTGGSSCCALDIVVTACDDAATISTIGSEVSEGGHPVEFVDLDLDGVYELVVDDWSLSTDNGGLALWPVSITRVLRWSPRGGWAVAPRGDHPEVYEAEALVAHERFHARMSESEDPRETSREGFVLALRAGGAAWLGGGSLEDVEQEVRESLEEGYTPDFAEIQYSAEEAPELAAAIVRLLDGYEGVRTVYRSESSTDHF